MTKILPSNTGLTNSPSWMWRSEAKALNSLYYEEDGEYFYNIPKLIEFLKYIGYEDAETVASEINFTSPEDELEFLQQYKPDLKIEDITIGMVRKGIEDEFEKR